MASSSVNSALVYCPGAGVGVRDEPDEPAATAGAPCHLQGVKDRLCAHVDATRQPTIRRLNASTMKHT